MNFDATTKFQSMAKRKKKTKTRAKLPRKLIIMKNSDKGCHEAYKNGQNPIRFPHPYRACLLGKVNSGKSMIVKNLLMAHQEAKPKFEQVIIVHGDGETKEYDDIDPTCIRNTLPEIKELDPDVKKLLIIDDMDFSGMNKRQKALISDLFRHGSTHRNTSIILSHQSFFSVPKICRDQSNVFILWKPHDLDTLGTIGRRVGLKKAEITNLFRKHLPNWRDSLLINMIPGAPAKFSKNLFEPIPDPRKIEAFLE